MVLRADAEFRDSHVWLTKTGDEDRTVSMVVGITPRVCASHPTRTACARNQIAKNRERVRIGGWLMLDPGHPDQIEKTHGTIWERVALPAQGHHQEQR